MGASAPDLANNIIWIKKQMQNPELDGEVDFIYDNTRNGWLLYSLQGNQLNKSEFKFPPLFKKNRAIAYREDCVIIDNQGKILLEGGFLDILMNPDGTYWAQDSSSQFHLYDSSLHKLASYKAKNVSPMFVNGALISHENGYRVIDKRGNELGDLDSLLNLNGTNVIDLLAWDKEWGQSQESQSYNTWRSLLYGSKLLEMEDDDPFLNSFKKIIDPIIREYLLYNYSPFFDEAERKAYFEPEEAQIYYSSELYYSTPFSSQEIYFPVHDIQFGIINDTFLSFMVERWFEVGMSRTSQKMEIEQNPYILYSQNRKIDTLSLFNTIIPEKAKELSKLIFKNFIWEAPEFENIDGLDSVILASLHKFRLTEDGVMFYLVFEDYSGYQNQQVLVDYEEMMRFFKPNSVFYHFAYSMAVP